MNDNFWATDNVEALATEDGKWHSVCRISMTASMPTNDPIFWWYLAEVLMYFKVKIDAQEAKIADLEARLAKLEYSHTPGK